MAIRNETADLQDRALLTMKLDAENNRRAQNFEAQLAKTQIDNQIKAAEFQAQTETFLASLNSRNVQIRGDLALYQISLDVEQRSKQVSQAAPSAGKIISRSVGDQLKGVAIGAATNYATEVIGDFISEEAGSFVGDFIGSLFG